VSDVRSHSDVPIRQGSDRMSGPSFLIFKLGAIGDVVMTLPVLTEIRRRHPDGRVTWVCGASVAPLVESTGLVDRLITVDEKNLYSSGARGRLIEILRLWARIGGRRYDRALVGYQDWRYRLLVAPALRRFTAYWSGAKGVRGAVPGRYHAAEYARLLFEEGPASSMQPVFPELRGAPVREATEGAPRIALAPGGAVNLVREEALRRWPIQSYIELALLLVRDGYRVALTGAPSDDWVRTHFEGLDVEDHIGKTSLGGLVSLFRTCDVVVTHDSGPLHLAILSGTSVVGLFGPTQPAEKTRAVGTVQGTWGGQDR